MRPLSFPQEYFFNTLLYVAGSAESATFSAGVSTADAGENATFGRTPFQFMHVMAGSALHLVIEKQGFIDRLPGQTGSAPCGRHRCGAVGQRGFGIANLIDRWIFQTTVRRRKCGVVGEGDRMHDMEIRSNLRAGIDDAARDASYVSTDSFVDGQRAIMTTQTSQRSAIWRADGRIQGRAGVRNERCSRRLVIPKRHDLIRVSIVRLVTGATGSLSRIPRVSGKIVNGTFDTFVNCRWSNPR